MAEKKKSYEDGLRDAAAFLRGHWGHWPYLDEGGHVDAFADAMTKLGECENHQDHIDRDDYRVDCECRLCSSTR